MAWLVAAPARAAIVFGQLNDFEDGTTMGWHEGLIGPNAPTNIPTGGEHGTDDAYLRNISTGTFGGSSKQVMFNDDQWTGNYNAARVTRIGGWMANFGPEPLHMRVAFVGAASEFSSTHAVDLPPDGVWRRVHFDLTDAAITKISGLGTLSAALSSLAELDLLSSANPVARGHDLLPVNAVLGVDDLRAMGLEGDANFDGVVNGADFGAVRANLGRGAGRTWEQGDFDFDGRVTARDMALLRQNFSSPVGVAAAGVSVVPEPAAAMVLLPALFLLLTFRRRPSPVTA